MLISLHGSGVEYEFDPDYEPDIMNNGGKFSRLYRGTVTRTETRVVIKHLTDTSFVKGESHAIVIRRIFESVNMLHPQIAQVRDIIFTENGCYIVRDYLQGIDLHTIIFDPDYSHVRDSVFLLKIAECLCDMLEQLHSHGIIHRNIKPTNIFILTDEFGKIDTENPQVRLFDFEYAQINGQNIFALARTPFSPIYSPPEQVLRFGNVVNQTADLYSLGICIYESFARIPAFDHENKDLVLNMQVAYPLVKTSRISKPLYAFLLKMTHKHKFTIPPSRYKTEQLEYLLTTSRNQRFQSATDVKIVLQQFIRELTQDMISNKPVERIQNFFKRKH